MYTPEKGTIVRGLFKFCGTDILMENKGGQFYIATFEPSTVSKKTLQGAPLSYDFRMKIKSCSALAINRGKNRFHIVVGYKAPDDLFCITADCNEKEWRLDVCTPHSILSPSDRTNPTQWTHHPGKTTRLYMYSCLTKKGMTLDGQRPWM